MIKSLLCAGLVVGLAGTTAMASSPTAPVPEIGPQSISAGLALLAGGVLLLRTRRRK
jgi:LPXTG-motif cell wall-anchored protein